MSNGNFSEKGFIRESGNISFQERPVQPSDFTSERGYRYAAEFDNYQTVFHNRYPAWQSFADCFLMRRPVIHINGKQRCHTASFHASDLKKYQNPGVQSLKNLRIPGSDRGSIPDGKYQLTNLSFQDEGNQITVIHLHYVQYGKWELVQVVDHAPNPAGVIP